MQRLIDGIILDCTLGNLLFQAGLDALAIPTSSGFAPGVGLAGAVHAAAGEEMYQECRAKSGALFPGQVILTSGYRLPVPWVLHCLVPQRIMGERNAVQLAACYRNALLIAEEHELESVGFASLAFGNLGNQKAIEIALATIRQTTSRLRRVKRIRLIFGKREAWLQWQELMSEHPESTVYRITG